MNWHKYLDFKYLLLFYLLGLGWGGMTLWIIYGWWGILIQFLIILVVSFPLAYWILKKEGWIEWVKMYRDPKNRLMVGLELMRKIRPNKIKYYEDLVEDYFKQNGGIK